MKPVLIENSDALDDLCKELIDEPLLAVDTEFFRETTYYPHLGLVQLASPTCIACVDPLAFDAREGLASLLLNPDITKIFHSCIQDLEVLFQYLGKLPNPIVDTQIAAAMLGEQDQIGYATLVELKMGVQLEKSQTRTNWLKRPLTARQIDYAGDDVLYLIPLYQQQLEALKNQQREHWLFEDCNRLSHDENRFSPDLKNCWRRIKGLNKLHGIQLAIAYHVAQWREELAIQKDLTRRKALPDETIIEIANRQPESTAVLKEIKQIHRFLKNDDFETLLTVIQHSLTLPENKWPIIGTRKPTTEEKTLLKNCLELIKNKSETLATAQSVLCSRKDVEKIIAGNRELSVLNGWRLECIGKELLLQLPT